MILLFFALVLLTVIDHIVKYKTQGLIFYKNAHVFSVVVAITQYNENIERIFEYAKKSRHEFVFVSINYAIDPADYAEIDVIEINEDFPGDAYTTKIPMLSRAYYEGYKKTSQSYVLFMNAEVYFDNYKTLDHMANNLVEHQIYTIKETMPFRDIKEGYKFFFDLFRDMSVTDEHVNFNFYAVKRDTLELVGAQNRIYDHISDFEEDVSKRNVSIIHINHDRNIMKLDQKETASAFINHWFETIKIQEELPGLRKMLLFLLAFHLFYFFLVYDFNWYNPLLFLIVQTTMYFSVRAHAKHHFLQYLLTPIYMLLFDGVLLVGVWKRFIHIKKKKHAAKKEGVQSESANIAMDIMDASDYPDDEEEAMHSEAPKDETHEATEPQAEPTKSDTAETKAQETATAKKPPAKTQKQPEPSTRKMKDSNSDKTDKSSTPAEKSTKES